MADIKQAAKWMRERKRVKIRAWRHSSIGPKQHFPSLVALYDDRQAGNELEFTLALNDLESDDWEIAE